MKYKCLTIAGFDGSGGAGILADVKTFSALGCYGMSVLTNLPVQNTCGVRNCYDISVQSIQEQMEAIFDDIIPDSIKIGLLFSTPIIECVGKFLEKNAKNIPIVLDPVMIAKSGDPLLLTDAAEALKTIMIPLATIITPNIPEGYALTSHVKHKEELADNLLKLGSKAVLLKGGHLTGKESNDLLIDQRGLKIWLKSPRIDSKNTHGTGCTLSAAITACLAQGLNLTESCQLAKKYLWLALKAAQDHSVGKGNGPVHHFYHLWPTLEHLTKERNYETFQ